MRGDKGSSHFEMIIGFVFFIGFVVFLFLFLNPWDNSSLSKSALNGLHNAFEEQVNVGLSSVFVKTNYTGTANCFFIELPDELFSYTVTGDTSRVTKLGGDEVRSNLVGDLLNIRNEDNYFRVAISDEFKDGNVDTCDPLTDFELGGVVEVEVVSNKSLTRMRNKYYSNYAGLKKDLRVADIFDFAIVPEGLPELQMIPADGIPKGVEVMAKDYVVKVLTSEGQLSNERISFRVW